MKRNNIKSTNAKWTGNNLVGMDVYTFPKLGYCTRDSLSYLHHKLNSWSRSTLSSI